MKLRARAWLILALVTLACVGIGISFAVSGRAHNDAWDSLPFKVESTPLLGVASFQTTTISIPTFSLYSRTQAPVQRSLHIPLAGLEPIRWLCYRHTRLSTVGIGERLSASDDLA